MRFVGRTVLSLLLVALMVIPPQVTMVPLLRLFVTLGLNGSVPAVWVYQVGFTVPFGIFLDPRLHRVHARGHLRERRHRRRIRTPGLPFSRGAALRPRAGVPRDPAVPVVMERPADPAHLPGRVRDCPAPITVQAAGMATAYGQDQTVMFAATFLSVVLPLVILLTLQRYFVRGILGGAVKG